MAKFKIVISSGRELGADSGRVHVGFRGINYDLVLKLGDEYTGFYFIMMYIVVEAVIMRLASSLQDCLVSVLDLEYSSVRDIVVHWPQTFLPYQENFLPFGVSYECPCIA